MALKKCKAENERKSSECRMDPNILTKPESMEKP